MCEVLLLMAVGLLSLKDGCEQSFFIALVATKAGKPLQLQLILQDGNHRDVYFLPRIVRIDDLKPKKTRFWYCGLYA